jgi:hypothetical protein
MRRRGRVGILVVLVGAVMTLAILVSAPTVAAQEYGESRGNLTVGQFLELSGDGFSANSAVKVQLMNPGTGETIDLGTLTSDDAGRLAGSLTLPVGLGAGTYTLAATGVTRDGATRILSAGLQIPGAAVDEVPCEPAGRLPVWLLVLLPVLGLLLMGGACWWFAVGRERWKSERPAAEGGLPGETVGRPGWRRWGTRLMARLGRGQKADQ